MESIAARYKEAGIKGVYELIENRVDEFYEAVYNDAEYDDDFDSNEKTEDKNVEDKNVEDKKVEDKKVEDKNVEDKNVEDKNDVDENVADENMEDKEGEENKEEQENSTAWILEFYNFLDEHFRAFNDYPQTIMDVLYHSTFLKYPEINDWFEVLKRESKRKPVELVWNYPNKFTSYGIRKGHEDLAKGLVSIGGNRFATSSEDGYMRIWVYYIESHKFIFYVKETIKAHDGEPVNNIAYHPGRNWIASCGDDFKVRLWDSETLDMIAEFTGHTDYVSNVLFNDNILFSASKDSRIGVWDINTLQNVTFLEGHTDWTGTMTISPDKKSLFSISLNNQLIEWDIEHYVLKQQINDGGKNLYLDMPGEHIFITKNNENSRGHSTYPHYAIWTADNKLYTSYEEVIIWDCRNWDILQTIAYDYNIISCFIIKDSLLITFSKLIKLYHLENGELIKEYQNPRDSDIRNAIISEDGQYLICSDDDGYITTWDWNELVQGEYSQGIGADMHSFEIFYNGKEDHSGVAVSGGFVQDVGVWDLKTGKLIRKIERADSSVSGQAIISKLHNHSDQVLIMYEKKVYMLSPFEPQQSKEIELPNDFFHPRIAIGTKNGIIFGTQCYQPYYINLSSNEISVFDKKYAYTDNFSVSPDERYALVTTYPQSFDQNGKPFENPWNPISSPLVLIDLEKEIRCGTFWPSFFLSLIKLPRKWEDKIQKKIKLLKTTSPTASAWSADSKLIAAGYNNGQIMVYNFRTKKIVKKYKNPEDGYIYFLTWLENGLLVAMYYGKIVLIDPKNGKHLKTEEILGKGICFRNTYQQNRYIIWSGTNKTVGIFDTLKFEMIYVVNAKVLARSVHIDKNRLLIGGEDGFLYGYDLDGIL